ncbi:MAG: hypothetical protein U9O78_01735 [Patescibacteria group bacterium]|nr:hypothetical protein [Patescibacteria group bacterium]
MYKQRMKYWPAYTWKIQTSYSSDIKDSVVSEFKMSAVELKKIYFNIFDKINASFYHLECLRGNEEIAVQIGRELAGVKIPGTKDMVGIVGSPYEPIGYEYEAFLTTIKSALDFIAMLLAKGLDKSEDNIISLVNRMRTDNADSSTLEGQIYSLLNAQKIKTFIDGYKGNRPGFKSKRNYAIHDGSLPVGTINIPINNQRVSPTLSKALDPNSPNSHASLLRSQNLIEFCDNQFYQTCNILIKILSLITNTQLTPGPMSSVYDQTVKKAGE